MKKWMLGLALCLTLSTTALATDFDQDVAVLNMMGVMEGNGSGDFMLENNLTRGEFCKMAVVMLGQAQQEPLYRNRTVFPDVLSTHWARGYINLAVSWTTEDSAQLIRGMSDGTFAPDRNITYAEAVTILMRMLGYSDNDAGMIWPQGYLDLATKIGLTNGLALSADQAITRGEAAQLFTNLLTANQKSGSAYYNTLGSGQTQVVLTDTDITINGQPAIDTSVGIQKLGTGIIDPNLTGARGVLLTDEVGDCIAFIPKGSQKSLVVDTAQAGWLQDTDGETHWIDGETPVYFSQDDATTYESFWANLSSGSTVTLHLSDTQEPEGMFVFDLYNGDMMVAPSVTNGNPFSQILGGDTDYTIYRNGALVTASHLAQYDVGSYNAVTKVLTVSSNKLTGTYENASPNLESPSEITVMGATLPVLTSACGDLSKFELGDSVTLLLTGDGSVAGVVSPSAVTVDNIGMVTTAGSNGQVTLFGGVVVHCDTGAKVQEGDLVKLMSSVRSGIAVYGLTQQHTYGALNKETATLGGQNLSKNCRFFDRVGDSQLMEISLGDILLTTVPNDRIGYIHTTEDGTIDVVVFENLTGDLFTYGKITNCGATEGYPSNSIYWESKDGQGPVLYNNRHMDDTFFGGAVAGKSTFEGLTKAAGLTVLTQGETVGRSDFILEDGDYYVISNNQKFLVAENVQCYNDVTNLWMDDFAQIRSFSNQLTVYYDRPAVEGGKIRVIVAES